MLISKILIPFALCAAVTAVSAERGASAEDNVSTANVDALVIGTWTGQMFDGEFTFELSKDENGLTGRLKSHRTGRWTPLENVAFAKGELLFELNSQPRSSFVLKPDVTKRFLKGNVFVGQDKDLPIPLKVERTAALP